MFFNLTLLQFVGFDSFLYCFCRIKEKRIAAFELATMAASGDDNKFRIVAEGG